MPNDAPLPPAIPIAMDQYLLCPLSPRSTNLPVTVYARSRESGGKVGMTLIVGADASLALDQGYTLLAVARDPVRVAAGPGLPPDLLAQVASWARLNRTALRAYWRGQLDGPGLAECLRRLPGPHPH